MIPFRPTIERAWNLIHDLRFERRNEADYRFVVHPALMADLMRSTAPYAYVAPDDEGWTLLGLPIEEDPRVKRGWIHLRHEVVK